MSDTMLLGVLRMPYELAMSCELSRRQFHNRAQEAANRIETDAEEIARLTSLLTAPREECTHQCIRCHHIYSPIGANEDCPRCGCDGTVENAAA